jgi:hypothetical protein
MKGRYPIMPIEFHCTQCGQRLRTPDDTAGKQARCPDCGTLVPIPAESEPSGERATPGSDVPKPDQVPVNPFADPPPVNPYQTPVAPAGASRLTPAEVRGRLLGPAVGMIAGAVFSALYTVTNLVVVLTVGVDQLGAEMPADPRLANFLVWVVNLLLVIVPVLVIIGAVAMLRVKSYGIAKTGAILALFPCHCCFPITLPFGIWGLMVLNDIGVRAVFQSVSDPSTFSP